MIKISVPNDDHIALRAMAKALEEIAVARGAPAQGKQIGELNYKITVDTAEATAALEELVKQAEVDTTAQQVESLNLDGRDVEKTAEMVKKVAPVVSDTDSTGTPWDERIHSASKALNGDGTWRVRRKPKDKDEAEWAEYVKWVQEDIHLVESLRPDGDLCEDEGCDHHGTPHECISLPMRDDETPEQFLTRYSEADTVCDEQEPSVTSEGDDFHVDAGVVTEQQVASFPPPPPPPASVFATVEPPMTFAQVMTFLTSRSGKITTEQINQVIKDMGLEKITDLNTQPEHTGPFIARVKALLGE